MKLRVLVWALVLQMALGIVQALRPLPWPLPLALFLMSVAVQGWLCGTLACCSLHIVLHPPLGAVLGAVGTEGRGAGCAEQHCWCCGVHLSLLPLLLACCCCCGGLLAVRGLEDARSILHNSTHYVSYAVAIHKCCAGARHVHCSMCRLAGLPHTWLLTRISTAPLYVKLPALPHGKLCLQYGLHVARRTIALARLFEVMREEERVDHDFSFVDWKTIVFYVGQCGSVIVAGPMYCLLQAVGNNSIAQYSVLNAGLFLVPFCSEWRFATLPLPFCPLACRMVSGHT